jgi:hypothetical protein
VSIQRGPRLGVFVLGMHRSGTSAASRLLDLLGFSVGPDADLLPADESNPTGFWESAPLVRLNRDILRALGGYWSAPPMIGEGWERAPELDPLQPAAVDIVRSLFAADQWACKDPRNCLTLPFWLRLVAVPVAVVLVHRNPLEVAESLEARDGLPIPLGLGLWERYVRHALEAARDHPVFVTSYEQLLLDPPAWCEQVGDFLRDRGAEVKAVPPGEATSFVQTTLRHSEFDTDAAFAHEAVSEAQRTLYAAVQALAGSHASFTPPDLPPETAWVEPLLAERRRALRSEREARTAEERLARIRSRRSYRALQALRALSLMVVRRRAASRRALGWVND